MILGSRISWVTEVVGAFLGGESTEEFADGCGQGLDRSRGGLPQEVLELGEDLLDRVQIGGIFARRRLSRRHRRPLSFDPLSLRPRSA
jgi:hypothetical protein